MITASIIAMIIVGGCLVPLHGFWEFKFTKYPVVPKRFVLNRTVVLAAMIGAFDFVRFIIFAVPDMY